MPNLANSAPGRNQNNAPAALPAHVRILMARHRDLCTLRRSIDRQLAEIVRQLREEEVWR